jgi:DNA-binding transcriptional ArsR family regulator
MRVNIDEIVLFHQSITPTAKIIYVYLTSIYREKDGVCFDGTSGHLSEKFGITVRSVQYSLKALYDFGLIKKFIEGGVAYPQLYVKNGSSYIPSNPKINKESDAPIIEDLNKLIRVWNELFDRNEKVTEDLISLFKSRLSDMDFSDILKSVRNRYEGIKDDAYWNDPSKAHLRGSLRIYLKNYDTMDIWRSSKKQSKTEAKAFRFVEG